MKSYYGGVVDNFTFGKNILVHIYMNTSFATEIDSIIFSNNI